MSVNTKTPEISPLRLLTRAARIYTAIFFTITTAHAAQLIIEPDMGREPILQAMNQSKQSIDLVMYGFTDETLLNTLLNQQRNGKNIKVILQEQPYRTINENDKVIKRFNKAKINWHGGVPPYRLIHQKTLIVDDKQAMVMTFNFTKSTFKKNNQRNFALLIDNPNEVKEITEHFASDWNHQATRSHSPNLIWSPDNSRDKLIDMINQAKQEIDIYAQNINDYKIMGALAKAARRGVKVVILTSITFKDKQANYLKQAGVNIHQIKKPYIHAKAFIFDHQKAVIGSINLTRQSLDDNRELSVVTADGSVVRKLESVFTSDSRSPDQTLSV